MLNREKEMLVDMFLAEQKRRKDCLPHSFAGAELGSKDIMRQSSKSGCHLMKSPFLKTFLAM